VESTPLTGPSRPTPGCLPARPDRKRLARRFIVIRSGEQFMLRIAGNARLQGGIGGQDSEAHCRRSWCHVSIRKCDAPENPATARALDVGIGAPPLRLTRVVHDAKRRPVERSVASYRVAACQYRRHMRSMKGR